MHQASHLAEQLVAAADELARRANTLSFGRPVTHTYNPLDYASAPHHAYIRSFALSRKRVVFWGMNPGPWGMAQSGVPFGEIQAVRQWMGIEEPVGQPVHVHPRRPIEGFACQRSEVSGRRLWGLMRSRFGSASQFFADHFVANYCPLVFMEESGKNRTPDKLSASERRELFALCDDHALAVIAILKPRWLIGVGKFAQGRMEAIVSRMPGADHGSLKVAGILHPSPANPRANREWERVVVEQLTTTGVW